MSTNQNTIDDHESPVRKIVSETRGVKYEPIKTLDEAKRTKNSYLVMEGDDGGQIYLVCPLEIIKCNEDVLKQLLKELDQIAWKDISMAGLYYEVHEPNTGITGGMGGGRAEKILWVHERFNNIKDKIQNVINGSAQSVE